MQIWKKLPRFKDYYEVSNDGFVRRIVGGPGSKLGRNLSFRFDKYGYRKVKVTVDTLCKLEFVHKLVAEAFIGPRPTGLVINHKDGNHLNNYFENLEYVTQKENVAHARTRGRCNQNFILNEEIVRKIKILMANGMREIEVVRLFGIKRHFVNSIRMGNSWAYVTVPTNTHIDP